MGAGGTGQSHSLEDFSFYFTQLLCMGEKKYPELSCCLPLFLPFPHLLSSVAQAVTLCLERIGWWLGLPKSAYQKTNTVVFTQCVSCVIFGCVVIFGWIMFLYSDKHWHLNLYFKVLNIVLLFWGVGEKYCKYLNSKLGLNWQTKKDYIIFKLYV